MAYRETSFLKYAALAVIVIVNSALTLHSLGEVLPIDLTTYGYIAHEMLGGVELYTNLWDHKPPGVFLAFMAAELLLGYSPSAVVCLGLLFSIISLIFLFLFLRKLAGFKTAIVGAIFWTLIQNSVYLEANLPNVELFLNAFTLVALWAFARFYDDESKLWPLFLCGAAFAVASLFKMVAVFPLIALCVYLLCAVSLDGVRAKRAKIMKSLFALLVPGALLWVLVFAYFMAVGRFGAFFDSVFLYNSRYSGGLFANIYKMIVSPNLLFHPSLKEVWILVLLSLAWLGFSRKFYGRLGRSLFIFLSVGLLIEIASPGKYYFHYYQLLMPMLAILPAFFFRDLFCSTTFGDSQLRRLVPSALLIFTFIFLAYYQFGYISRGPEANSIKKYDSEFIDVRDAALYIKGITAPCETIYSWGEETGFYYYSQRSAASGIFFIYALFFESEVERSIKLDRLYDDLLSSPPALFVVEDLWAGKLDARFKLFLQERYRMHKRIKSYSIYELRERPGC
jgi:4-amino-4-deoxy-L-arabinose transferase-like glycosyltransferase